MNRTTTLPTDSAERKRRPLYRGPIRYFPAALAAVAEICQIGNEKHNPGQELHHSRGKSIDHADCIVRHLIDMSENGGLDENGMPQVAYIAWRALALAQEWLEANQGAPLAPGAKLPVAKPLLGPEQRTRGTDRRLAPQKDIPFERWTLEGRGWWRGPERRKDPRISAEELVDQMVPGAKLPEKYTEREIAPGLILRDYKP